MGRKLDYHHGHHDESQDNLPCEDKDDRSEVAVTADLNLRSQVML